MKRASQFKKSQTVVSTTERQFTLSVVCLIVECTKDSVRVTKKIIQIVVGRLGWKWIERSVLQLPLVTKTEVELLHYYYIIMPQTYDVLKTWNQGIYLPGYKKNNTLSGLIGKVVASYAAVARSIPAEVALIFTMHEALRRY